MLTPVGSNSEAILEMGGTSWSASSFDTMVDLNQFTTSNEDLTCDGIERKQTITQFSDCCVDRVLELGWFLVL